MRSDALRAAQGIRPAAAEKPCGIPLAAKGASGSEAGALFAACGKQQRKCRGKGETL